MQNKYTEIKVQPLFRAGVKTEEGLQVFSDIITKPQLISTLENTPGVPNHECVVFDLRSGEEIYIWDHGTWSWIPIEERQLIMIEEPGIIYPN